MRASHGGASIIRSCAGLADGTLNRDAFRRYVTQGAFFQRAFLRAYALAAAKSEYWNRTRLFHELMGGVVEELKLHESDADRHAMQCELDFFSAPMENTPFARPTLNILTKEATHGYRQVRCE